jgi:hypothetical protein
MQTALRAANGVPSLRSGRYFRNAHDRLIRRHLLGLSNVEKAPDHSWQPHRRSGLPHGRSASS